MIRSEAGKIAQAAEMVEEMLCGTRGAALESVTLPSDGGHRGEFRVFAVLPGTPRTCCVALFADFCAAAIKKNDRVTAAGARGAVPLSPSNLSWALTRAAAEARLCLSYASGRDALVVLALRTSGKAYAPPGPAARQFAHRAFEASAGRISLETWHVGELQFNPLTMEATPRHVNITGDADEIAALQEELGSDALQRLPSLAESDMPVRWFGLRGGAIVRVDHVDAERGPMPTVCRVEPLYGAASPAATAPA